MIPKYVVLHGKDAPPLGHFSEEVGLDIETEGDGTNLVHPAHSKLKLVQIMNRKDDTCYIFDDGFDRRPLWEVLAGTRWVGHNLHFDVAQSYHHMKVLPEGTYDTMVVEGLLNAARIQKTNSFSLKSVTKHHLGKERDKSIRDQFFNGSSLTKEMLDYAAEDAQDVLTIKDKQMMELRRIQPSESVLKLECKAVIPTAMMSYTGMKVDVDLWSTKARERFERLAEIDLELDSLLGGASRRDMFGTTHAGINFNSPVQVKAKLEQAGISLPNTQSGTILEALKIVQQGSKQYKILDLMSKRSALKTVVSTFGEGWLRWVSPITGRVHGSYFQTRAETGRYSGSQPNLTNIPRTKEFRSNFIADEGRVVIKADYGQQEARINAFLSGEKVLIHAFENGIDPYLAVARTMFDNVAIEKSDPERGVAKTIFLGLTYGMGVESLAYRLGCTASEARKHLKVFRDKFRNLYGFAESVCRNAEHTGYAETVLGRRRYGNPTDIGFTGQMRNHPVQGTAADMLKLAVVHLYSRLGRYDSRLINAVHDETVTDAREDIAMDVARVVRDSMLKAAEVLVDVPFEVDTDIGYFWGDNSYKPIKRITRKRRARHG